MKSTSGKKLPSGTVVVKGNTQQKMRCPRCSTYAIAVTNAKGKQVYSCGRCGAQLTAHSL